jgi:hypothetical protein
MSEDLSRYSLNDLRVEEEELRQATLFPVSVIISETEFVEHSQNVAELVRKIEAELKNKYAFQRPEHKKFKEGFLEFNKSAENMIECYYAKETPTKITFEHDDLRMHNDRLKLINPSYSAKIKIVVDEQKAKVTMFGGSDLIIQKALYQINLCIRDSLTGGHRTIASVFSKEEMNAILESFGVNVEYIWIHPGESERFAKIVEKKVGGEVKKVTEYIVHAKLMGYHITGSPVTVSLVKESGIHLKEIQGRLPFAIKVNITSRVSSEGRVLFYIPENLVSKKESFYDIAENLYGKIATHRAGAQKQTTIGEYIP